MVYLPFFGHCCDWLFSQYPLIPTVFLVCFYGRSTIKLLKNDVGAFKPLWLNMWGLIPICGHNYVYISLVGVDRASEILVCCVLVE